MRRMVLVLLAVAIAGGLAAGAKIYLDARDARADREWSARKTAC